MQPQNRRAFFREVLRRVVEPAADFVEDQIDSVLPQERPLLRPPGALAESAFLETCHRCGSCIEACPADAILPFKTQHPGKTDTPYIDPQHQPCVVCDDLACMTVCPSGALQSLGREEIRMGLALLDAESCIRSQEEDCRICADLCPIGPSAIEVQEVGSIMVHQDGCVGCGICENACPTSPSAIEVRPIVD
jgi:ferredoxin-type protein NapG